MPIITTHIAGDKEVADALRKLGYRAPEAAGRALYAEAQLIMSRAKRRVPVAFGALKSSGVVFPPVIDNARGTTVTFGFGGPAVPYALYVHEGTGPAVGKDSYWPPVQNLEIWAQRVLGDPRAAYPVGRKIFKEGIKPNKYLEEPFRQALPGMGARLAARLKAELKRAVREGGGGAGGASRRLSHQATKGRVRRRILWPNI